jgi:RNA polymerase sigma factor (sigma-70 family)
MAPNYACVEQSGTGIAEEEYRNLSASGEDASGHRGSAALPFEALYEENTNLLLAYFRELHATPLLSLDEETALGKELVAQGEKKHALTERWMLLAGQLVDKQMLMQSAPIAVRRIVQLCLKVLSLHTETAHLKYAPDDSLAHSHEPGKPFHRNPETVSKIREIVARVNLLKVENTQIFCTIETGIIANGSNALKEKKEFYGIIEELKKVNAQTQALRETLVKSNLRLSVFIAKRHTTRGLVLADLIQEGNIGLMKAAEKFDYRFGARFSTYAYWWIRQAIKRFIDEQSRSIHVPVYMGERIKQLNNVTRCLIQSVGEEQSTADIAAAMGVAANQIDTLRQIVNQTISLESTTAGEAEYPLKQLVVDPVSPTPLEAMMQKQLAEAVDNALRVLSRREAKVMRLRYGLAGHVEHTLAEIGEKFGLSRERVRQIEFSAMKKLRNHKILREFKTGFHERVQN